MNTNPSMSRGRQLGFTIGLWLAQLLLALVYIPAGSMKLFAPLAQVAANIPWAGDVSETFLRLIGVVDLSAGVGIMLPSLTRIYPRLTVVAAVSSIVLQVLAIAFHASRGELMVIPFNLLLIALAAFVAWGRSKKVIILPR